MAVPQLITSMLRTATLWLAFTLWFVTAVHANPIAATGSAAQGPLGRGVFSEFQMNYYMGELFAQQPVQDESGIKIPDTARMQLTIVVDEWSKRRFSQYWSQALLINNNENQRNRFSSQIQSFHNAIKGSLYQGDQLVLEKTSTRFRVKLNGISLMWSSRPEVFDLFANVWLGARPPSSEFKASILGQADDFAEIFEAHTGLAPSRSRIRAVQDWSKPETPASPAITTTVAAKENLATADKERAEVNQVDTTIATGNSVKAIDAPVAAQEVATATKPAHNETTAGLADNDKPKAKESNRSQQPKENRKAPAPEPYPSGDKTGATALAVDVRPAKNSLHRTELPAAGQAVQATTEHAEEDPLLKIYRSNILTITYQNLIYPPSAIDRGHEGKVKLRLTLSRKGKVKNFDFTQKSKYGVLNRAVEKAVSAASPYPAPPRKLRGNEIIIEVPITFSLSS